VPLSGTIDMLEIASDGIFAEPVEIPEAYEILLRMEAFNMTGYWSGGYADQPRILMLELEAAKAGEEAFKAAMRVNVTKALSDISGGANG
jgi:hypothetical protein